MELVISLSLVDWARLTVALAATWSLVSIGIRYVVAFRGLSTGQKLFLGSLICFLLGYVIATGYNVHDRVGFRWSLVPTTVGVLCTFIYSLEPVRKVRRRVGQDPFHPKK